MDGNQVATQAPSFQPESSNGSRSSNKFMLAALLLIFISIAAICATYYWQHKKINNLEQQIYALKGKSAVSAQITDVNKKTSGVYEVNTGVSYPLSLPHKEVLTTLYLPRGNSILQTSLNTSSQDELASNYTESYNDIIANWNFSEAGTVQNPSQEGGSNGGILITALNDWMKVNDPTAVDYGEGNGGAKTIAMKSSFASNLKTETTNCAKDIAKGFTTKELPYNICYTLLHPQGQGGDWILSLSGYADIEGTQSYLRGTIYLPDATYQAELKSYLGALKNISSIVKVNPNNP